MSLIKCPECGGTVSDKAAACPHCGMAIATSLIKCPECGETIPKDSVSCPNCAFPLQEEQNVVNEETVTLNLYHKEKKEEAKPGPTFSEAKQLYESNSFIPAYEKINIALSATPANEECLRLKAAIVSEISDKSLIAANDLLLQKKYAEAITEVQSALRYAPHSHELKEMLGKIKSAKSRRRTRITAVVVIVIVAALSGIAYSAYNSNLKADEEEAWTIAKDSSTVSSLQRYMEEFPGGEHAFEAEKILMQLRQADANYWENIRQSGDVSKFEEYKTRFPQGQYLSQADNSIDSLDWVKATKSNTPEAYASYLSAHPQGYYAGEAATAQNSIKSLAPNEEEIQSMKDYFSNYYTAVEDKDDNSLLDFFESVTRQYYGIANAKKGDILSNLKNMHNKDNRQLSIQINDDDFKVVKDASGNLNVTFTIGVSYGGDGTTAESTSNMAVSAVVNSNKKIVSISSKKAS